MWLIVPELSFSYYSRQRLITGQHWRTSSIPTHCMTLTIYLLSTRLTEVCSSRGTEKLCVQYFKPVAIIRLFINAERSGDWQLHGHSVWLMIPYLHAAGHLHYARSAQLYLREMLNLANSMAPDEYDRFTSRGFFTVRRSDKRWCGEWTDMTIE